MAVLSGVESAEFTFLKQKIGTTDGNLSIHLRKLEDKNYIKVTKEFVGRKPISRYSLTSIGRKAFEDYVNQLEKIINK
jgi:DNA-binding MarR family transcriptional regulator